MREEICAKVEFLAGGAFSTAYDQFRFAEMLRLRGKLYGVRVLSPAIIKAATTIQTGNKLHGAAERDHTDAFPANIGLSIYVRGEGIFLTNLGSLISPGTFAGSGFGGQLFCVDPERDHVPSPSLRVPATLQRTQAFPAAFGSSYLFSRRLNQRRIGPEGSHEYRA